MKSVAMSGSPRADVGKKDAKALRVQGKVPCVLYGGTEQASFSVDATAFKPLLYTPETLSVQLDLGGRQVLAVLHDLQLHPVTDAILHADFLEVVNGKPVTVSIPVKVVGNSEGVKAGGKLVRKLRKLRVSGLIENMPEYFELNIEKLNIGDAIRVSDMSEENISFLDNGNMTIVTIQTSRNVVAAADDKAAPAAKGAPAAAKAAPAAAKK
jgi:large subunit ribosomal protein L25